MTVQQFIEKMREGGCTGIYPCEDRIWLDPEAWKAVGKVEGWTDDSGFPADMTMGEWRRSHWNTKMTEMVQALIDGKTIEQFLETL